MQDKHIRVKVEGTSFWREAENCIALFTLRLSHTIQTTKWK